MPLPNPTTDNMRTLDNHIEGLNLESLRPRNSLHIDGVLGKLRAEPFNHVGLLILRDMNGRCRDAMACDARDLQEVSDKAFYFRHSYAFPIELDFTHINEVRQNLGLEYAGPEDRMTPREFHGSQG